MRNAKAIILFGICLLAFHTGVLWAVDPMSDLRVRQLIVEGSVQNFLSKKGDYSCPCPYSKNRTQIDCGQDSAYYTNQGSNWEIGAPQCYPNDVSQDQVEAFRELHNVPEKDVEREKGR